MTGASKNSTQVHVGCLVIMSVMGKQGKQAQVELEDYINHNGLEWTCARYKNIYTAALHLKNGDPMLARECYQKGSIAYHKESNLPKGPWGTIVSRFVSARQPKVIRKYAACLRVYTDLTLVGVEPTKIQSEKAVKAISAFSKCKLSEGLKSEIDSSLTTRIDELSKYSPKSAKSLRIQLKHPIAYSKLHATSYYYTSTRIPGREYKTVKDKPYGSAVVSLLTETWIPSSLERGFPCESERENMCDNYGLDSGFAGRILGMQQQGCKLRVVAQPTAVIQKAFVPLHDTMMMVSEQLFQMESCVKNQNRGAYAAKNLLNRGHSLYSVDLSSATDRFPRVVTQHILDFLGLSQYSQALEDVCNRPWRNENLQGPSTLYYECGQPMGLYGSFPMFHVSNMVIADIAQRRAANKVETSLITFNNNCCFMVVGDDIVISDPNVAEEYTDLMCELGVEISPTKTFSGKVGEFAGFVLCPTNVGYTAYRPYKFPVGSKITNPLEFVHALGSNVSTLSQRWESIFKAYQSTQDKRLIDLSPIVIGTPEEPIRISGKEPWVDSLVLLAQNAIKSKNPYFDDYIADKSGYYFRGNTTLDFVKACTDTVDTRFHLGDVHFTPEIAKSASKKAKQFAKPYERIQDDPLIRDYFGYYPDNSLGPEHRPHVLHVDESHEEDDLEL